MSKKVKEIKLGKRGYKAIVKNRNSTLVMVSTSMK